MADPISMQALVIVVTVTMGLMKLLEVIISSLINKDANKKLDDIYIYSRELHDMHNKFDSDGTPLWYVPRSWSKVQTEILKTVNTISHTQEKLGDTISRISNVLDKIEQRVEND